MATSKKRINISLSPDMESVLEQIAKRDAMPQATKAVYLIKLGLELEEDDLWNALAAERDTKDAKFLSHKDVWA